MVSSRAEVARGEAQLLEFPAGFGQRLTSLGFLGCSTPLDRQPPFIQPVHVLIAHH
jgi:hypothetical protein